jgi:DNA-directed RNA polymerase subunit RPC12/RpoP
VIRFKCIYCGQRILAQDNGAGKKGKCPKCRHELIVPRTTKGRPAISSDKEPMPERPAPYVPEWNKDPRFDGANGKDEWTEVFQESFGFLVPTYDKLSLFLMAVTWITLYLVNNHLHKRIHTFLVEANDWRVSLLALTAPAVLIFCIYQVFIKREKSDFERTIMLWFAIATNLLTGIVAGIYLLKNKDLLNWQIIFPIWNLVNVVILHLMLVLNIVDENCIVDRDATVTQIILGLMAVIIIVLVCNFIFKLHWSITFSICIVYTTSFDRALQSIFPRLSNQGEEQSS